MKTRDVNIIQENPFANCKLEREPYANTLTTIIEAYSDGFVFAVNGKWGTGKTTFMKMWRQSLDNNGYKTVFFNAWENDFTSEPLVAILGELRTVFESDKEKGFNTIIDKAYKFSTTVLPALAKTAATIVGAGHLADAVEKISEATVQAFNDEISEYDKKKESLAELKTELSEFIKKHCGDKPLVFIVDELDRCRPDYAVEVLEKIKHFFSVDGIVFVLAIDKEQLSNSIKGYYGSDRIDSPEYLRRFIDLEYTLPEPKYENFAKYLYDYYQFADFFELKERTRSKELSFDPDSFFTVIKAYCEYNKLTLRQLEKIFAHTRIVVRAFQSNNYIYPREIFFLVCLKEFNPKDYNNLRELKLNIQTTVSSLEEIIKDYLKTDNEHRFVRHYYEILLAKIIWLYYVSRYNLGIKEDLYNPIDGTEDFKLAFSLQYADSSNILSHLSHRNPDERSTISNYLNKIDLLESLKS